VKNTCIFPARKNFWKKFFFDNFCLKTRFFGFLRVFCAIWAPGGIFSEKNFFRLYRFLGQNCGPKTTKTRVFVIFQKTLVFQENRYLQVGECNNYDTGPHYGQKLCVVLRRQEKLLG
jgi:hypothetical protein